MFCCTLLYVHSSFVIILMGKREQVALLSLSFWCLVIVVWLFLAVLWVCLQFVIVVFPDHKHFFWNKTAYDNKCMKNNPAFRVNSNIPFRKYERWLKRLFCALYDNGESSLHF